MYALGCLAYDLLTGRRLFRAANLLQLIQEKLTLRLPPARDIGDGISAELYEFIESALRVDPDERPSTTAGLVRWAARCVCPPQDLVDEQVRP